MPDNGIRCVLILIGAFELQAKMPSESLFSGSDGILSPIAFYSLTECSRVSWNTMSGQRSCVNPKFTRLGAR
ncbi:Uncharacterised protein [Neisseria meningitidis]|uniref:Uncharacterized protein n=1 Tax=Neisseria meningitidis TaxID=487 RepID=A0A422SVV7_NEIME|nr:hypothetical protein DE8669_0637 [Neisseria meningitidis]EJU59913.1 hypothetical protein NMEN183_0589 [Neisseria meningitidis NM183]EJU60266.1 hypothetical protein NMEN140_0519 [Neisseria meningitidis NM140]EJU61695.1 hypothetical protein NMEN2781_0805 [Neisseria meningitidis NM2781]EJU68019.1 hypothetical protein NMEN576_0457 [Neisseria meningitidis NM576]ELL29979.1 hypothetical protein NM77221_0667 [Neisseria meningitidis 77221]EOC13629.1 hypothetical protein NM73696_0700 [Neisseria meni